MGAAVPDRDRRRDPPRPARRRVVAGGLAAACSLKLRLALGAGVLAVRVWPAREYTRVTLELEQSLEHTHLLLSDPPRLVVDLEGIELDQTLRDLVAKVRADDPYIEQVRVGQFKPRVVRLVFDLKTAVAPQLFTLAPVGAYRHRVVLDLYPLEPVDPLRALLAQVQPPGATAREDPIDALIRERDSAPAWPGAPARLPELRPAPPMSAPVPGSGRRGPRPEATRMVTIALDAGHGGEDPGAIGRGGTREKDVAHAIAQLLRERIDATPNMRAYMTRDADYFVPLAVRVSKARRVQADLFVSIHADAFVNPDAHGASVYVLSEDRASSGAARWLADRENRADLIGGVNLKRANHEAAKLLLELSTTTQIRESSSLGHIVLDRLGSVGHLHKPAVEKAGFAVLRAPDIPSILVETAFISNPAEERRLADSGYQARIAEAVFQGIRQYLLRHPPPPHSAPA
ncbi:MAG: N-acetylmuramoyl-L-alanine amidase [Burkholderiaceae bacterium]|nr:N-acetylmuramoyl-L-alanine amidase [Burkholderiaceae bacterium]